MPAPSAWSATGRRRANEKPEASPTSSNAWGGVTIAYRRRLIDSPSYTLNHEEVEKALEEGSASPRPDAHSMIDVDPYRPCRGDPPQATPRARRHVLPARAILVAAGTKPNTVLAREDAENVPLDGQYFQALERAERSR